MDNIYKACSLLPQELRRELDCQEQKQIEEIRLRLGRRPSLVRAGEEIELSAANIICEDDILFALEKASGASMHAAAETLAQGYITYKGLRIGVCGEAVMAQGHFSGYRKYSSLNIRIPCAGECMGAELKETLLSGGYCSTLIISPPGYGKTTLLREIVLLLSEQGTRVGVIDDRNELFGGENYQGRCTDVISMAPKKNAALILLRGMNPQVIAMDEISAQEDLEAAMEIAGCAVKLTATLHAADTADMRQRGLYKRLLNAEIFKRAVIIKMENGRRKYKTETLC